MVHLPLAQLIFHIVLIDSHFTTEGMAAQRGHETCLSCTGRERGRIWTHILWPQNLTTATTTIAILVRGQKQLTCLTISLIFIGFPLQISRGIVPCALPCLSISWEADSPSEPGGRLILTKIRARRTPHLLLYFKLKKLTYRMVMLTVWRGDCQLGNPCG